MSQDPHDDQSRPRLPRLPRTGAVVETLEERRLLAFGKTDVTFADHGRAITDFADDDLTASQVRQISLMSDGTTDGMILAGGSAGLARYTPSGLVDHAFGTDGAVTFGDGENVTFAAQAVNQSSGDIYVLASRDKLGVVVMKFDRAGHVVSSFGDRAGAKLVVRTNFSPRAIAVDENGKVIVAGTVPVDAGVGARVRLYRLTGGGAYDGSFGTGSISEFQIGSRSAKTPVLFDAVAGIATTDDGGVLVGGGSVSYLPAPVAYGGVTFAVAKLTTAGLLDTSYGVGGITHTAYATSADVAALGFTGVLPTAFAARDDGSAYLAARGAHSRAVVAAYDQHGALKFSVQPYDGFPLVKATGLATLADGRAVVLGQPNAVLSHGLVMAAISATGEVGHFVYTDDLVKTTRDIRGDSTGAIAESVGGKLLIGGGASGGGGYEVIRFAVAGADDPRPDEFLNARTNDIATDASGGLHVAFFDLSDHLLKYAYRAANGLWSSAVVVDPTINAGQYLSIAVDSKRMPSIAYYVGGIGDLRVATTVTRTNFTTHTVDSKGSVGLSPSLAIDAQDRPSVSYYRKTGGDLRFAWMKSSSAWGIETIDGVGDMGRESTLVLSPNTGRFTVAYVDADHRAVKWATRRKAGQWLTQTVAKNHGGPSSLSMAYGYYFRPAIAWYESKVADLHLALFENGRWTVKTLSSKGAIGQYSAVLFKGFFEPPQVFCYNRSRDAISMISVDFDHSAQMTNPVSGGGRFLSVTSLGADADIAYFDPAKNAIVIRKSPPLG